MLGTALRKQGGLTLIELVTVITILGILLAIGGMGYATWQKNQQIRAAVESIQNGLRFAQQEAVKRNTAIEFLLTNGSITDPNATPSTTGTKWMVRIPTATPEILRAGTATESTSAITVCSIPAAFTGSVQYNGLGRTTTTADIKVKHSGGDRPLRVQVALGGSVRMCNPAFSGTDPQACDGANSC